MAQPAHTVFDLVGSRVERFEIKSRLGSGGMGDVYLAEDTVLKRPVALKSIRAGDRRRLFKEAERASQLNDEHVARVHDVIEDKRGRAFLVMEYVEGQTLRARLNKGAMGTAEFFNIAAQCLSGLAAAHDHGILHCDLKPENMVLTPSGVIKLLDFGFARVSPGPQRMETVSAPALGGTLAYLAPEVLMGATPDERSDLFSLGVVFYEALAGHRPFVANALTTEHGIGPADPSPLPPSAPAVVQQMIKRMIARDPQDRYQNCAEILAALRSAEAAPQPASTGYARFKKRLPLGAIPALLIAATVGVVLAAHLYKAPSEPVAASSRVLVVLPFTSSGNDANTRAFSAGLTEVLTAKLGQVADRYPLEIVGISEVRSQKVADAQQARAALGANLVLEGSLQESGNTIRVVYNLVETRSLRQVHSGVVTADSSNPFAVEDRVIDVVLNDLNIELGKTDRGRIEEHGTGEAQAYDAYLRGRGYLQGYDRADNLDEAIASFESSMKADPRFALAYAGLGQSYLQKYALTHSPQLMTQAKKACSRAVELDAAIADGEICLGMLFNSAGEYEKATEHLGRAVKLDGSRDESYRELAIAYEGLKKLDDAEAQLKRAIAMRPQYWGGYKRLGRFYYDHGRYDEAIAQFNRVVALAPDSFSGYSNLGAVYLVQGNYDAAIRELERSKAIRPTAPGLSNLGALYFYRHDYPEAARNYQLATRMNPDDYVMFGNLAEAYREIPGKQGESRSNYTQALKLAQQRLTANPRDAAVMLDAAVYAAALGESAQAERYRQSGLKLSANNNDPLARLRSAQVLAQLHRDPEAIAELDRALNSGLPVSDITNDPSWARFQAYPRYTAIIASAQKTRNK